MIGSDFFGYSEAFLGVIRSYIQGARGSGRTTRLLYYVVPGDRVVFINSEHARRFHRLLNERGVPDVECFVLDPRDPSKIFSHGPSKGRTIFDHVWLEQFYCRVLEGASRDIAILERESGGYGEAHREKLSEAKKAKGRPRL